MIWIYLWFSYKIRSRKESRMLTLHQVSVSLHCSPFKCTAKAQLIIKDWFKRPFYNLSKHWAWLMLHIISLLSFTATLHVYYVSHSPSVPAPIYSGAAGPWGLSTQQQPWAQLQQLLGNKSTALISLRSWTKATPSQGFGSSLCRFPKLQASGYHRSTNWM